MKRVRIYLPSKSAMQSGLAKTHEWIVEFERCEPQNQPFEACRDTTSQLRLKFPSLEAALSYVYSQQLTYTIATPTQWEIKPKSYGFRLSCPRIS